jgi:hypothetical protein
MDIFLPLYLLALFGIFIGCPLAAGWIASRKGRSALLWAFFGLALGIFGVLIAALVRPVARADAY